MTDEYWYRIVDETVAYGDYDMSGEWEFTGSYTVIRLKKYRVVKHTPCGVQLDLRFGMGTRFVNRSSRKRFACPTVEEAKESFLARKKRQIGIYEARLRRAREAVALCKADKFDLRGGVLWLKDALDESE